MTGQSQGIQQLLVAEKRAAEKVQEARKRKPTISHSIKHSGAINTVNIDFSV